MKTHFPYNSIRPNQEELLEILEKEIQNYNYFVLQMPVGSGKSPIAITLAKYLKSAHILTPHKSLQDQYQRDFELLNIKGKNAYNCPKTLPVFTPVDKAECEKKGPAFISQCITQNDCEYYKKLYSANSHDYVLCNFHSFIYQNAYLGPKNAIIVDECHKLSTTILDIITEKIDLGQFFKKYKDYTSKEFDLVENEDPILTVKEYFKDIIKNLREQVKLNKRLDPTYSGEETVEEVFESMKPMYRKLNTDYNIIDIKRENEKIILEIIPKAIPKWYMEKQFFNKADKIIFMSGTIFNKDHFCNALKIPPEQTFFYEIKSDFPNERRPIILKDTLMTDCSPSKNNWEEIRRIISLILEQHYNQKGIIHLTSYSLLSKLLEILPEYSHRFITHTQYDRDKKLMEFFASTEPLVLISPAVAEGVDFKDDRARFQIITRVPYPNTQNKFIQYKLDNKDFYWYNIKTLETLVQMIGRVMRSQEDLGVTYLLDNRFKSFLDKTKKLHPEWLSKSIIR